MLKSPTVLIGALGFVVALGWFAFGGWLSGAKPVPAVAVSTLPPPPPLPAVPAPAQPMTAPPPIATRPIRPVRIHGGMTTVREGTVVWLWVSEEGQLMTEEEIAGESGGTVSSRMVRGVRVLTGTGVIYGGTRADTTNLLERVAAERAADPAPALSAPSGGPSAPGPSGATPAPDPPPSVPQHPGILATPPGLL